MAPAAATKNKVSRFLRARQLLNAAGHNPRPDWTISITDGDAALAQRWLAILAAGHVDEHAKPAEEGVWPPNWVTKTASLKSALGKLRGKDWMADLVQLERRYNLDSSGGHRQSEQAALPISTPPPHDNTLLHAAPLPMAAKPADTQPAILPVPIIKHTPAPAPIEELEAEALAQRRRDKRLLAKLIRQVEKQTLQDNTNANANPDGEGGWWAA